MRKILFVISCAALLWSCEEPKARKPVSYSSGSSIDKSVSINKKRIAIEEKEIADFVDQDTSNVYIASQTGFWYTYKKKDSLSSRTPKVGELVTFTYDLKSLRGTVLLSKSDIGTQVYKIDQSNQDLISGIRDGLKIMKEGEIVSLILPSHKAYGYYGFEDKIDSNRPVIATVELLKIEDTKPEIK